MTHARAHTHNHVLFVRIISIYILFTNVSECARVCVCVDVWKFVHTHAQN